MTKIYLRLLLIFIFSFVHFQTVFALDCKTDKSPLSLIICDNVDLIRLNEQVEDAYQNCLKLNADYIKRNQIEWIASINKNRESISAKDDWVITFMDRLSFLRGYYFDRKKQLILGPTINKNAIPYMWMTYSLDGEDFYKYPILENKIRNPVIEKINFKINEIGFTYFDFVKDDYLCMDLRKFKLFETNDITIDAEKANLFGFTINPSSCLCGCSYPEDLSVHYLWDVNTGKEIESIFANPYTIRLGKIKNFWEQLARDQKITLEKLQATNDCKDDFINTYVPKITLVDNAIHVSTQVEVSGYQRLCGNEYDLLYEKYRSYFLEENKAFINYLPRFVEAGLLTTTIEKKYLAALK